MVVNVTKIPQKLKKINWLGKEKKLQNEKKRSIIVARKYFN